MLFKKPEIGTRKTKRKYAWFPRRLFDGYSAKTEGWIWLEYFLQTKIFTNGADWDVFSFFPTYTSWYTIKQEQIK